MISEVVTAGLAMTYVNFVTHDSYIFAPIRDEINNFINRAIVQDKWYGQLLKNYWGCHLCHNFSVGVLFVLFFNYPFIICLASPIVAAIISSWLRQNN